MLLFTYRKIVVISKSVELEHTPSSFPQSKRGDQRLCNPKKKKKKKASSRRIFHVSSLTTGSPLKKQQEKVKSQQLKQDCILPDLQSSRTKRFSLRELKTGFSSWITSTRLQAEISTLACPRGSHPARGMRVYNVLAYFYADYFDAGTLASMNTNGAHLIDPCKVKHDSA